MPPLLTWALITSQVHLCTSNANFCILDEKNTIILTLDILFRQIATLIKVCVAFVLRLQTFRLD